jgi:hypothetical protein
MFASVAALMEEHNSCFIRMSNQRRTADRARLFEIRLLFQNSARLGRGYRIGVN